MLLQSSARSGGYKFCVGVQGSIGYAVQRLDEYRQRLESRMIEKYDGAVAAGNLSTMAQCARIMSQFQRGEETCVQVGPPPSSWDKLPCGSVLLSQAERMCPSQTCVRWCSRPH